MGSMRLIDSLRILLPYIALALLAILFRIPYLINPEQMSSEHSFLGLQGLRLLSGDFSLFLWGSNYQTSWEPFVASIFFTIFGKSFFVLQWVPFSAFLLCLFIIYYVIQKEVGVTNAFFLSLILVFVSQPVILVNVLPYRQWSLLFSLLPILMMCISQKRFMWITSGFLLFFSMLVDLFAIELSLPLLGCMYLKAKKIGKSKELFIGAVVGGLILLVSRAFAGGGAPIAFSLKTLVSHFPLFFKTCLPVFFGVRYPPQSTPSVVIEDLSDWVRVLCGLIFLSLFIPSFVLSLRNRQGLDNSTLLSLFGSTTGFGSVIAFMGSSMSSDIHSVRYLPPIVFAAPFAFIPFTQKKPDFLRKSFFIFLGIYLIFIGLGGWRQATPWVMGIRPIRDPSDWVSTANEMARWLKERGIHDGFSDYWKAYTLSFLFEEDPLIVPRNSPDRYAPYRTRVLKANLVAEIFTPSDSPDEALKFEGTLKPPSKILDRWTQNGFTAFIINNK